MTFVTFKNRFFKNLILSLFSLQTIQLLSKIYFNENFGFRKISMRYFKQNPMYYVFLDIWLLTDCLSICFSIYLSVCLSISLFVCLSFCLSVLKIIYVKVLQIYRCILTFVPILFSGKVYGSTKATSYRIVLLPLCE